MWIHGIYRHILAEIAKIEQFFMLKILDEKITGRIKIIFARLINDANVVFSLGLFVRQNLINLADNQIFTVLVLEANGKSGRVGTFHR